MFAKNNFKKALWLLLAFQLSFLVIVQQAFADKEREVKTPVKRSPTSLQYINEKNYQLTPEIRGLITKLAKSGVNPHTRY